MHYISQNESYTEGENSKRLSLRQLTKLELGLQIRQQYCISVKVNEFDKYITQDKYY